MNLHQMTPEQLEALPASTIIDDEFDTTFEDECLRECCSDACDEHGEGEWDSMSEGEKRHLMLVWIEPMPCTRL